MLRLGTWEGGEQGIGPPGGEGGGGTGNWSSKVGTGSMQEGVSGCERGAGADDMTLKRGRTLTRGLDRMRRESALAQLAQLAPRG